MKLETWVYKQALELYPKAVRDQFGSAMLETYSDGLKAAKLEGKAIAFHWNTVLDTIKSVARATAEVKNADPVARVVAVLGIVLFVLIFAFLNKMISSQTWFWFGQSVWAFLMFGFAHLGHHLYPSTCHRIFSAMFNTLGIWALLAVFAPMFVQSYFPLEYVFFSFPETYLDADLRVIWMIGFGLFVKYFWIIPAALAVIGSILETFNTRRILPMNGYNSLFLLFFALVRVVDPRFEFLPFRIVLFCGSAFSWLMILFCALRLWQLPRALPRVIKAT
jgi:hypothetical protein